MKPALCAVLLAVAIPVLAQEASKSSEPKVQRTIIEDDGVRIEELRVRGQTQRMVVRSKQGPGGTYEVVPEAGRDPSSQDKGAAGKRVWNILAF